jgi:hypothetical protein
MTWSTAGRRLDGDAARRQIRSPSPFLPSTLAQYGRRGPGRLNPRR